MSSWHQLKLFAEHAITIDHDALHVILGLVIWLVLCLVLRRTITETRPLLWTFAIAFWNEAVDLWTELWPDAGMQFGEGAKDLILTIFVPAVVMVFARFAPRLFDVARKPGDQIEADG
jgi:hypothetical protein